MVWRYCIRKVVQGAWNLLLKFGGLLVVQSQEFLAGVEFVPSYLWGWQVFGKNYRGAGRKQGRLLPEAPNHYLFVGADVSCNDP